MARVVPPLNPLRVFEAAARLGSFTKAAEELFVSQSAVSRQVSLLERYFAVKLFERHKSGVVLTEAGARYFTDIGAAFGLITGSTERLLRLRADEPLSLRVYSTFAAKWLMRRLSSWELQHPDIRVRIATALVPVDFLRDSVDASIEVGDANWREGVEAELLFENTVMPVCSPGLLRDGPPLEKLEDVLRYRLIHSRFRPFDWHHWLHAFGLVLPEDPEPLIFSDSLLAYQAAADGLGIAQGQPRFLVDELAAGTLVPAFPSVEPVALRRAYYFVTPRLGANAAKARLFLQWLQRELERDES